MLLPVLPLSQYVAILAQCVYKLAQKDIGDYDTKVLFLFIQPFLSQKIDGFGARLEYKFVKLAQPTNP